MLINPGDIQLIFIFFLFSNISLASDDKPGSIHKNEETYNNFITQMSERRLESNKDRITSLERQIKDNTKRIEKLKKKLSESK